MSCICWPILVGGGLLALRRREETRGWYHGLMAASMPVVAVLFVATWNQTKVWHDSESLWPHALRVGAPSATAHLNYGNVLYRKEEFAEATKQYTLATQVRPDDGNAWGALGVAMERAGDYAAAEEAYRNAIRLKALKGTAYMRLGDLYIKISREGREPRLADAAGAYRSAVDAAERHPWPASPWAYLKLGLVLTMQGETEEARAMLEVASQYEETRERASRELNQLGQHR